MCLFRFNSWFAMVWVSFVSTAHVSIVRMDFGIIFFSSLGKIERVHIKIFHVRTIFLYFRFPAHVRICIRHEYRTKMWFGVAKTIFCVGWWVKSWMLVHPKVCVCVRWDFHIATYSLHRLTNTEFIIFCASNRFAIRWSKNEDEYSRNFLNDLLGKFVVNQNSIRLHKFLGFKNNFQMSKIEGSNERLQLGPMDEQWAIELETTPMLCQKQKLKTCTE